LIIFEKKKSAKFNTMALILLVWKFLVGIFGKNII